MGAFVFTEVPYSDVPASITADQLPLVWVDHDVVDLIPVQVVSLHCACLGVPDLDCAVLGARRDPFALNLKGHARHVASVPFQLQGGRRVGGADVIQLDILMACCCQQLLVRRDA